MTELEAIDRLIEAVEAGTAKQHDEGWMHLPLITTPDGMYNSLMPKAWSTYHGDLNAAKALHEALLPGWNFVVGVNWAEVFNVDNGIPYGSGYNMSNAIPARAWLLAILRAHRHQIAAGGE